MGHEEKSTCCRVDSASTLLSSCSFQQHSLSSILGDSAGTRECVFPSICHDSSAISDTVLCETEEDAPLVSIVTTYIAYFTVFLFGHIRDFFGKRLLPKKYSHLLADDGYAPLVSDFESFYSRHVFRRLRDSFNRIISSCPAAHVNVLERQSKDFNRTFVYTGRSIPCINLGSYNYLGFAQASGPCTEHVLATVTKYGLTRSCPRISTGTLSLHLELESLISNFLGCEDSICLSMGFATNSTTIPALVSKGSLIISDELNHASIVFGSRLSGADVRVFKHNSPDSLESILRDTIAQGQPRTHRPWRKILVIVEGLYSMEGTICKLPDFVRLRDKYKFYLYMDEAHSIGAVGPRGRGVCDYYGINPKKVDILMGTFTKSFGSVGGYIAGSRELIAHMRVACHSAIYAEPLPIPAVAQIISSTRIIMGLDGTKEGQHRITRLADNSRYFRQRLHRRGLIVYGQSDSPVIPILIFLPTKLAAFSRECLARGVAVVIVGAPATPLVYSRARICLSASHTKEDLDHALQVIDEVADVLWLKISRRCPMRFKCESYGESTVLATPVADTKFKKS